MADSTGIFAKIKMTSEAKSRFFNEKGNLLVTDDVLMKEIYENNKPFYEEQRKIEQRQMSDNPMSINEYMDAINHLNEKHTTRHTDVELLIIRYDYETESLFYFQMFRYNAVENLKTSISLQTFLDNVAQYKDSSSEDFIFFSDSATNLLVSQFYKIWKVSQNLIQEIELKAWDKNWDQPLQEVDLLSKKYYFDIVDKYMKLNESEGYWECDDEGLENELEKNSIDNELINSLS